MLIALPSSTFPVPAWRWWGLVLLLCLVLGACSYWRDAYLNDGVGEVTEDEVREKWGNPHIMKASLLDDETTWSYRFVLTEGEMDPMGLSSIGKDVSAIGNQAASIIGKGPKGGPAPERVKCFRYNLIFNQEKILKTWNREPC